MLTILSQLHKTLALLHNVIYKACNSVQKIKSVHVPTHSKPNNALMSGKISFAFRPIKAANCAVLIRHSETLTQFCIKGHSRG